VADASRTSRKMSQSSPANPPYWWRLPPLARLRLALSGGIPFPCCQVHSPIAKSRMTMHRNRNGRHSEDPQNAFNIGGLLGYTKQFDRPQLRAVLHNEDLSILFLRSYRLSSTFRVADTVHWDSVNTTKLCQY